MKAGPFAIAEDNDSVIRVQAAPPGNRRVIWSVNNMKQIGLAMFNYACQYKTLPPAYTTDKNGKPLLSWRVLLLPYMDEDGLYKQFHLDEPWDSEHNKPLVAQMPQTYRAQAAGLRQRGEPTISRFAARAPYFLARRR